MAVIRCPNCGKPNPDFLRECQYCEAKLQPEGAAPATPPSAASSSAEDTFIQKPAAPPAAPVQSPEAEADTPDWVGQLRRIQSGESLPAEKAKADEPDWMWTGGPADEPKTVAAPASTAPAPAQDSSVELPEWLRDLDQSTDFAPATPAAPTASAAPAPPAAPVTSSRAEGPITAAPKAPPEPSPFEPTAADQTIPPRSRRKLTDWLDKVKDIQASAAGLAEPEQQVAASSDAELPDWLKAIASEAEAPGNAAPGIEAATRTQGAPGARPTPEDELPDWLRALRTQGESSGPVPGADGLQGRPSVGTSTLPGARPVQELPESMRSPAAEDTLVPRSGAKPLVPVDEDMPDWLRGIYAQAQEAVPAASDAARFSPAATDVQAPAQAPVAAQAAAASSTVAPETAAPQLAASTDAAPTPGADIALAAQAGAAPSIDETLPPPTRRGRRMADWIGSVPAPAASATPAEEELPDWLSSLPMESAVPAPEQPSAEAQAPVAPAEPVAPLAEYQSEQPLTPAAAAPTPEEELPDWLKTITTESQATAAAPTPAPVEAAPQAEPASPIADFPLEQPTAATPAVPTQQDTLPDWLKAITQASATAATAAVSGAETTLVPGITAQPAAAEPITDDHPLQPAPSSEQSGPIDAAGSAPGPLPGDSVSSLPELPQLDEETLAWLNESQKARAAPAGLEEAATQIPPEKPAWLDELAAVTVAATPELAPTPEEDLPDWLRALRGQTAEEPMAPEAMPDWLRALRGLPPSTPTAPGAAMAPLAGQPAAETLRQAGAAIAPSTPASLTPGATSAPPSGLEQAALPAWLAAMRPVDIEHPATTEADSYEETLGVLAGMRGVLRAEPIVAQLHKATTPVHSLTISHEQTANANLLTDLLRPETAVQAARPGRVPLRALAERWAVFAVLLVALLLAEFQAQLGLPDLFAPPSPNLPPESAAVYTTIEGLPKDKPALVAFDYDAAQQGELDPGAQAVIRHLAQHGVAVVGVSLRLTGAAVGEQVLSATAAGAYVNLGFIPGGPVGLLQFAADPRSTFSSDFAGNQAIWSTPIVANVHALADFGLIVLVSGAPESARAWMEQAESFAVGVPTVAVISAGAEPMLRPYYDDPSAAPALVGQPPIKGLIVGLGGAAAYERATHSPGAATVLWPALGGGLLAAALIIALGNFFFVAWGAFRRRRA